MIDIFSYTGIIGLCIVMLGLGFSIALILISDNEDTADEYNEECTRSKHYYKVDPSKQINYCFCGNESFHMNDFEHLYIVKE